MQSKENAGSIDTVRERERERAIFNKIGFFHDAIKKKKEDKIGYRKETKRLKKFFENSLSFL